MHSDFGPVIQHGYIVPSIAAVVPQWAALGVGPFYVSPPFAMDDYVYRGRPGPCFLRVANAYWGDIQVELLEPVGEDATLYRDAAHDAPGRLNHFASVVANVADVLDRHNLHDKVVQSGRVHGLNFAYVEGLVPGGVLLEIFEEVELSRASADAGKRLSRGWNGTRPLRLSAEMAADLAALRPG